MSDQPLLRIVRGDPSPEEVAALVSVVSAMASNAAAVGSRERPRSEWAAPHRRMRATHRHGPGAWRFGGR